MSTYFSGDLVQNKELDKTAKQKAKRYLEISVPKAEKNSYLDKGWELKREFTKKVRLRKKKDCDKLLEDETWLLFKNMGFIEMNKDRNFKIRAGPIKKQIDVFARDDNNIFIVECKALAKEGFKALRQNIHEILSLKKDLINSIRQHYERDFLNFCFLLVTRNIKWSSGDKRLADGSKNKGFFYWRESELAAYNTLIKQFGDSSRFLMYSIFFRERKIPELTNIEVPAIYGGKGKNKYYYFIIQPEKLLRGVAYVHRREKSNPEKISGTYQRMVSKTRLTAIRDFIEKGGFFPNNVILNFTKKPTFEKKDKIGDIRYGILKFPPYYASAWIIDGQHRLYGYLNTTKKKTANLPVIAFESLRIKDQANLFVEINKEQKKVSTNLLWDLYSDIYSDSDDPKQQQLRTISLIVKKLNAESTSPFYKLIKIPSQAVLDKKLTNLTLLNICDGIKENRLVDEKEKLLYERNYEYTVDFAYRRLEAYFNIVATSFSQDWNKGEKGLLRTNIGIRIFLIIFRQLLRYLKYKGLETVYRKQDLSEFRNIVEKTLGPILNKLKSMKDEDRTKIRKESNKALIMQNAQKLIWDLKERDNFGLELWRKGGWTPDIPTEESDQQIKRLINDTEIRLRSFVIQELKTTHGNKWWKQGVPEDIKKYIAKVIHKDISASPWKERELLSLAHDEKFSRILTSHFKEIIINRNNWPKFKAVFAKDKEVLSTAFKFFETIRNKYKHSREKELGKIEKGLGYWNMKWIRRCIGLNS